MNLTYGSSRVLDDVEASWFDSPLVLSGKIVIAEVVFWGPYYPRDVFGTLDLGAWVHLVRARTPRHFALESKAVEVAVDELPAWESWISGANTCPVCGGNNPQNANHQPGCPHG